MLNDFKDLSLDERASWEEVKRSYMDQLKVWHPDRFGKDENLRLKCEEKTKEINHAFNNLKKELSTLEDRGVDIQWDQPLLPQLTKAGLVSYANIAKPSSDKKFVQEPLVGSSQAAINNLQNKRPGDEFSWPPQLIAALLVALVASLASCVYFYQSFTNPKVVYGPPADLSKFKKTETELPKDDFKESFDDSVAVEQLRPGDGLIQGQLGGARMISGVSKVNTEEIPKIVRAASRCDTSQVQSLISGGANVNSEDFEGMSSLSWAAKKNCDKLAKLLLTNGANINHMSANGFTPIAWARWYKNIEVIRVLELESRYIKKK